jgi:hypothetical protein
MDGARLNNTHGVTAARCTAYSKPAVLYVTLSLHELCQLTVATATTHFPLLKAFILSKNSVYFFSGSKFPLNFYKRTISITNNALAQLIVVFIKL